MEKKTYHKPKTEVVEINVTNKILLNSDPPGFWDEEVG